VSECVAPRSCWLSLAAAVSVGASARTPSFWDRGICKNHQCMLARWSVQYIRWVVGIDGSIEAVRGPLGALWIVLSDLRRVWLHTKRAL
jgi:hypothetical protein